MAELELVREKGGGDDGATLRGRRREDVEVVPDLCSAEREVAGGGRSGGGGGDLRASSGRDLAPSPCFEVIQTLFLIGYLMNQLTTKR